MARFRCPSASTISSSGSMASVTSSQMPKPATPVTRMPSIAENPPNHPAPAHRDPTPARKLDKGKGRARSSGKVDLRKRESLRMSIKKAEVKNRQCQFSFVYVGNLSSDLSEKDLEKKFATCGPVRLITMRASSGVCVPTRNLPGPYWGFLDPPEGTHYATVEFLTPAAARKALEFNGAWFAGRKIIVSFSAIDLPETTEILKDLVEKKQKKRAPPPPKTSLAELRTQWKIKFGQIKRLTIEKTEYVSDPRKVAPSTTAYRVVDFAKRVGLIPPPESDCSDTIAGGHNTFTYPHTLG